MLNRPGIFHKGGGGNNWGVGRTLLTVLYIGRPMYARFTKVKNSGLTQVKINIVQN